MRRHGVVAGDEGVSITRDQQRGIRRAQGGKGRVYMVGSEDPHLKMGVMYNSYSANTVCYGEGRRAGGGRGGPADD